MQELSATEREVRIILLAVGIALVIGGIVLLAVVAGQSRGIECIANLCPSPGDRLYVSSLLPIFMLSLGAWLALMSFKKK